LNPPFPTTGGSAPLGWQSQKSRLGDSKVGSPHWATCSESTSTKLFFATYPNFSLMDPLSAMLPYIRAAMTKSEVVLIWFCVIIISYSKEASPLFISCCLLFLVTSKVIFKVISLGHLHNSLLNLPFL
jgi:hypothetical protein